MPSSLGDLYKSVKDQLSLVDTPDLDARIIIEERTGLTLSDIIAGPHKYISAEAITLIQADVKKRLSGVPVSRLYNRREFWGLPFEISEHTLDPRPDTERLVEIALERFKDNPPKTILDLGTGTGCILIALLHEFKTAQGIAVDVSAVALNVAERNAILNNVHERVRFIKGSWLESVTGKYDLIVSNPPYIEQDVISELAPEVKNHEPILALDGGADGLQAYKNIFLNIKNFLNPGGTALFEIGFKQGGKVSRLSEDAGFVLRGVHVDYAGNPRVVEISCGDK